MIIGASGGSGFIFIIVLAFAVLYLIVIRPSQRRKLQQQRIVNELHVGDEVLTAGGIYGTISEVEEDQVTVEIAPNTEVRVARRAIAGVTPKDEPEDDGEHEEPEGDAAGSIPDGEPSSVEDRG